MRHPSPTKRPLSTNHSRVGGAGATLLCTTLLSTALLSTALILGACSLTGGDQDAPHAGSWRVQPGALVFYGDTSETELSADTVRAGEPVRVSATTFGGGCTRPAGMRIEEVRGRKVVLTPMDSLYTPRPNEACTMILKVLPHSAEVSFEEPGAARIVIEGIQRRSGSEEQVRLERTVFVTE